MAVHLGARCGLEELVGLGIPERPVKTEPGALPREGEGGKWGMEREGEGVVGRGDIYVASPMTQPQDHSALFRVSTFLLTTLFRYSRLLLAPLI